MSGRVNLRMLVPITLVVILLLVPLTLWFRATQPVFGVRRTPPGVGADPARLEAHVRTLSEELSPRDASHPEGLDRAAAYIHEEFTAAGGVTSDQPYEVGGRGYRNVVASFGPATGERVVIGAHYDAAGPLPGADDNASGVAGLLELARLLGQAQLPLRVELVAFTLEEPPFFRTPYMGSAVHARRLNEEGARVRAMLSLEMIGYFSQREDSQRFPSPALKLFYPSRGDFITVAGKFDQGRLVRRVKKAMLAATPLPVYSINAPRSVPGIDFSDQLNYWEAGYDAAMITDTAFYRNPNYHTQHDTAGTLDYRRMAMVVEGVYAAALDLSR